MLGASCVLLECDDPVWPALRRISDLGVAEHSVKHTLDSFEVNVANAPRLRAPNCGSADKAEQLDDLRPGGDIGGTASRRNALSVRLDPDLDR